jgi:integrase
MTVVALPAGDASRRSPFAGVDVCAEAGFRLPPGGRRSRFEHDVWDFAEVIGLPVQMQPHARRLEFTPIVNPAWRVVAKELMLALLAPRHEAVATLPRATRTALHLRTCRGRLVQLTAWLNWLDARGVVALGEVRDGHCHAYLAERGQVRDAAGDIVGQFGPPIRRAVAQSVVDLVNYRELFSADRVDRALRPWAGATPSAVAGMPNGRDENKTAPLGDTVLAPMLAAALYVAGTLGPPAAILAGQARDATRARQVLPTSTPTAVDDIAAVLHAHRRAGDPLPLLGDHDQAARVAAGWDPDDPLVAINFDAVANEARLRQFHWQWLPPLRDQTEQTVAEVGTDRRWGRDAQAVLTADGDAQLPWTLPLHGSEVVAVTGVIRTACLVVVAAISGMRASELMELVVGCRRPPEPSGDLVRYRLASKIVKGQPLGGTDDEWVVIEAVHHTAGVAEQLLDHAHPGDALFGRFGFRDRYRWFRAWVNGPAGARLGLAPIPAGNVTPRILRRTLAVELAYRPGGILATKIHLKHISVATTEGYASRPGGAQGQLLAEINRHEQQRNLDLVLAEFRSYQNGVAPAGPGARDLNKFFATVDSQLPHDPATPKVQGNDREVLTLLSRRAATLHLGAANYCWFADPSKALCLKLAGTPNAEKPLAGMCDSSRCPQATHHPCHRPVWAERASTTKVFLDTLGPGRRTERTRLQADYDRARRVVNDIDAAMNPKINEE